MATRGHRKAHVDVVRHCASAKHVTYVDYKINLLDKNDFTRDAGINTDDIVALGLVLPVLVNRCLLKNGPFSCLIPKRTKYDVFFLIYACVHSNEDRSSDENDFCRAVCLAAALLMGCDEAPETTAASPAAQVLEGKTMGTLWRVSVVGIGAKRAASCRLKSRLSLMLMIGCFLPIKTNSALMRFNHSRSRATAGQRSHMADIVTLGAAYWRGRMARWISPWARWSVCGVWRADRRPLHIPAPAQIDAAKAKTGRTTFAGYRQELNRFCKRSAGSLC